VAELELPAKESAVNQLTKKPAENRESLDKSIIAGCSRDSSICYPALPTSEFVSFRVCNKIVSTIFAPPNFQGLPYHPNNMGDNVMNAVYRTTLHGIPAPSGVFILTLVSYEILEFQRRSQSSMTLGLKRR
jgi:hypothetical protein